jgi:hypothetical protein
MGEYAFNCGWLNTFSRTALGLINKARARLKGLSIRNAVHKLIELAVAEHYWDLTREVIFVPVGFCKAYDGISRSKQLSFEVKFEKRAAETFNLCFEYSYSGKPSGLAATEATKWVHVIPTDRTHLLAFEFDVDSLRETLKHLPLHRGGDGMKSQVKLLSILDAEKLATDRFSLVIDWDEIKPYW